MIGGYLILSSMYVPSIQLFLPNKLIPINFKIAAIWFDYSQDGKKNQINLHEWHILFFCGTRKNFNRIFFYRINQQKTNRIVSPSILTPLKG